MPHLNCRPADGVLDLSAIDKLLDLVGGDKSDLAELIESFLKETPPLLRDLRQALEAGDTELLRRAAHTLKSTSRDFGATHLAQLSQQMEALGREKVLAGAAELLAQIEVEYQPARAALEKLHEST